MRIRKHGFVDESLKDDEILTAARAADALAHPARIRMLRFILTENLARRTVTNKDLVREFDYAQATISQHVSKLLVGDLIEMKKKGTSSCYFAKIGRVSLFVDTLKKIETPGSAANEMPNFLQAGYYDADDAEDPDDIIEDLSQFPDL